MIRGLRVRNLEQEPAKNGDKHMRAVVWTRYGPPDVLQLQEVEKPTPKDNEVLIKVHAATVTAGDCEVRRLQFPFMLGFLMRMYVGIRRPKRVTILGQELAGEIEAIGKDVTLFKEGDQVLASTGFNFGSYAEYKCLPEDSVMVHKPANMTFEEAASLPLGGLESLHFLGKANIQRGQKVLINGAGGSIGTYGVQLAKSLGGEVTGVDSAGKLDMLRSIGADHVIDYTKEDFTKSGQTYEVIFDVVGKSHFSRSMKSLNEGGFYLIANPRLSYLLRKRWSSGTKNVITEVTEQKAEDLLFLKGLVEEGKIKSVIDRSYPLEQVADAHRYVETGEKKGNVIIDVVQENRIKK
jgi:NADPH:quinone reductase-like Zn-dependent oxidoreductase